jgi:hypothetical protein
MITSNMKTLGRMLVALWIAGSLVVLAQDQPPLTVAIFDFESKDENVRDLGSKVATLLNAHLTAEPNLILVERAELEKVIGEQELNLSGTVSQDAAINVGNLTGARVLVTGRVFRVEKELFLVSKVIGTETGRVYGQKVQGGAGANISELSSQLATRIASALEEKGSTLVAKVVTREERIARLRKALPAGPFPSVSVKIPERHFGGPVIDPAAETELGLILQECGFRLLDGGSAEKADIQIGGEAFSAFGFRKGNLHACKARVEIKAVRPDGTIVAVDRQTSVAVDIAEQTAAKTALQNAVVEMVERLVPKLARR